MRVKSFFTLSMGEAIAQARKELGPDCVLLNSRKVPDGPNGARYEVVFGIDGEPVIAMAAPAAPAVAAAPAAKAPTKPAPVWAPEVIDIPERVVAAPAAAAPAALPAPAPTFNTAVAAANNELEAIRTQIDELRNVLGLSPNIPTPAAAPAPKPQPENKLQPWRERLAAEDCFPRVISDLLLRIQERMGGSSPSYDRLEVLMREEFSRRLPVPVTIRKKALALVGPPGAGKTTTLVKLAVQHGIACGRSVQIISADPHRVAGGDLLRSYASILGVNYVHVDTFGGFVEAVRGARHRDLILVDTPGYSATEQDSAAELARYFEVLDDVECQLVLPASMKNNVLSKSVEFYSMFRPSALIFTRLDEAEGYGALASLSMLSELPISFLCAGQSIPDDLRPAGMNEMVERICGPALCVESVA